MRLKTPRLPSLVHMKSEGGLLLHTYLTKAPFWKFSFTKEGKKNTGEGTEGRKGSEFVFWGKGGWGREASKALNSIVSNSQGRNTDSFQSIGNHQKQSPRRRDRLFNPWGWNHWKSKCRKMRRDTDLTLHRITGLNAKGKTTKLLKKTEDKI